MKINNSFRSLFAQINLHCYSLLLITFISLVVTYSNLGITKEFIGDDAGVGYYYSNTQLEIVSNMWDSYIFPGRQNVVATIGLIHVGSRNILNRFGLTPIFIDRLYYFFFYFVSGLGMYVLSYYICNKLVTLDKKKLWFVSVVGAVFYMLNNFSMILLSFPTTNYLYSYMFLPLIFLLYLKDYHVSNDLWHKLAFGITILLFLSGNPANTISSIFLLLLYELFVKDNKISHNINNFISTLMLILLLSSFIYFPLLVGKGNPYGKVLSSDNRNSISFSSSTTSIDNLLRLRGHHSQDTFIFNEFLLNDKIVIANYFILMLALLVIFKKNNSKLEIFLFFTFIIFLFLAKAEHAPLSCINKWIYTSVPLFEMYRGSYFKFASYCVFSISILLPISLLRIGEEVLRFPFRSVKKYAAIFTLIIIIICAKPFFSGEVVRDIHKTTIPIEYHTLKAFFDKIKTDFSVLSLPQLPSGLVLDWGNGNYYGGAAHPDFFMVGKPVWNNGWFLPDNQVSDQLNFYINRLNRSNLKYVLLHKDIPEKYSFEVNIAGTLNGQTNFNILNNQIVSDKNFKLVQDNKYFKVFEVNQQMFGSHFYIPRKTIVSTRSVEGSPRIVSQDDWGSRSAVFYEGQNVGKAAKSKILLSSSNDKEMQDPVLEFKKINSSKYRVRVHSANGLLPVVFSESIHEGWKAYLSETYNLQSITSQPDSYKILDGNEEDQASANELKNYVQRGYVTNLGSGKEREISHMKWNGDKQKEELDYEEKYKIDFVSKNFQGTIQNDNLPAGHIWETWFQKPIVEEINHLIANGYANSWIIDVEKICKDKPEFCFKKSDGTYDFEMVIEFWPQRMFYLGIFISVTTLLSCLLYLGYSVAKRTSISISG